MVAAKQMFDGKPESEPARPGMHREPDEERNRASAVQSDRPTRRRALAWPPGGTVPATRQGPHSYTHAGRPERAKDVTERYSVPVEMIPIPNCAGIPEIQRPLKSKFVYVPRAYTL